MFSGVRTVFNSSSSVWHQLWTSILGVLIGFATFSVLYLIVLYVRGKPMPVILSSSFLMYKLCSFKWYRKWYGGRWEEWIVDDYFQTLWFPTADGNTERPPGAHGTPNVENYRKRK